MKNSIEFLEEVIDSPSETLGMDKLQSLDFTVDYLINMADSKHLLLLNKTIDELFLMLSTKSLNEYDRKKPDSTYIILEKLYKSERWGTETFRKIWILYCSNFSSNNLMEGLLLSFLNATEEKCKYLGTEELESYFLNDKFNSLDQVGKVEYCLFALNICFLYNGKGFNINTEKFSLFTLNNLLSTLHDDNETVVRVVIFTLYWYRGGFYEENKLPAFTQSEQNSIYEVLHRNIDFTTNIRIASILIKSSHQLFSKVATTSEFVADWAISITKEEETNSMRKQSLDFIYDEMIQKRLIESIDFESDYLLQKLVIPYLCLMASESTIKTLFRNLDGLKVKKKFYSSIILYGLGRLKNKHIQQFSINSHECFELSIKFNSDLCYQVMGKDKSGKTAWYFVLVTKSKKAEFLEHKHGDSYDIADYGKVIASGYGEEVPEDIREILSDKYGFDNF